VFTGGGVIVQLRHLESVEGLFELEPTATYADRAAAVAAALVGAGTYRVELTGGGERPVNPRARGPGFTVALRLGNDTLGQLTFWAEDGSGRLSEDQQRIARWCAKTIAKGIGYAKKLSGPARTDEDVSALLRDIPLTPRERDVVGRLVAGSSTRDISSATGLTISTVNTYMKRIFAKLGVHSRVELLARVTRTHGAYRAPDAA
jgi:DNA-binding CsgD family transcriptional regulator